MKEGAVGKHGDEMVCRVAYQALAGEELGEKDEHLRQLGETLDETRRDAQAECWSGAGRGATSACRGDAEAAGLVQARAWQQQTRMTLQDDVLVTQDQASDGDDAGELDASGVHVLLSFRGWLQNFWGDL